MTMAKQLREWAYRVKDAGEDDIAREMLEQAREMEPRMMDAQVKISARWENTDDFSAFTSTQSRSPLHTWWNHIKWMFDSQCPNEDGSSVIQRIDGSVPTFLHYDGSLTAHFRARLLFRHPEDGKGFVSVHEVIDYTFLGDDSPLASFVKIYMDEE